MADRSPGQNIAVTSNEPVGEKHLVLPYDDQPMVHPGNGRHTCEFCGNPAFRRSRLRLGDLPWVCLLHWPLRCTRCGQRQRASVIAAIMARRPRPHGDIQPLARRAGERGRGNRLRKRRRRNSQLRTK